MVTEDNVDGEAFQVDLPLNLFDVSNAQPELPGSVIDLGDDVFQVLLNPVILLKCFLLRLIPPWWIFYLLS